MNFIQPQDSLDNLSNLQVNRQRQLLAQVKQLFTRGLEKLQMSETRQVGIAQLKKLIEQYRDQQFLRGYIAIMKTLKPNSNSATKEHQILVVSILAQTYKQGLLDPLDKPPSLLKTAFRLAEIIHGYFNDHSPTVQQACARALLDLNTHCLGDQNTENIFSIIYAPLISILKSGVDKSSQATASASLSQLINYNRKVGGEDILRKLSPELLSALFKVNSEYHELFQAALGMLESQGLAFADGRLVAFLSKIKSVIDGTRQIQSTNTTNLNAYMCKVNICKIIEKIGRLLPSSEKDKLYQLRIPQALQQAARHRIIQVQLAATRALKVWKGQLIEEQSHQKSRGLSSLEEKRNSKKIQRSKSKDDRDKAESELTFMKEDLQKMVKGGWGASNRAKNYVKRGTGVGGGHISKAELSPQSKSGGKSHKEHLEELREYIKKGAQQNRNMDRFVGLVGQQFQRVNKSPEARKQSSEGRGKSPPARAKSPVRNKTAKISNKPVESGDDQFNFVEDEGDQMVRMPDPQPAKRQRSAPKSVQKSIDSYDEVIEENQAGQNTGFDDVGISRKQAEQLLNNEKDLFQEARKMNIDYTKLSQQSKSPKALQPGPPGLEYMPLQQNYGYMYAPQEEEALPVFNQQQKSKTKQAPIFKGLSEEELGQIVQEYNLSQVSQNLNDVLSQSDIKNFQASKHSNMDSRILEPIQGKSQKQTLQEVVAEKKQKKSAVSKFLKKEPQLQNSVQIKDEAPLAAFPKQILDVPAYSLNFTESGGSKAKSPEKRQDIHFTLNPKQKFSSLRQASPGKDEKEIEEQIVMSQYQQSFPAKDQPLPVILPKVAPITQVPLRHSLVPPILQEKQPSSVRTSNPPFIHELSPSRYEKKEEPEAKVDYQNLIRNPPRQVSKIEGSNIKGSKITEKSYQEKSKISDKTEGQNISLQWLTVLDKVHSDDYNQAYEAALNLDDPIYLLRLMLLSKIPLKKLCPDIFRKVWGKFMEIHSQKFIDVLTVGVLAQGNQLDLLSKCLSVEETQQALVGLYELSGSSKGKLSYKAANLYNQIDKKLHPG